MADQTRPTQSRHPWRATLRTTVAVVLPLVPLLPQIIAASGLERYAWSGGFVAAAAALTRILAIPGVNAVLQRVFPPLAAAPKSNG